MDAAKRYQERPFLLTSERVESFASVERRVEVIAAWLAAGGVSSGDRVVLLSENSLELVQAWLAIIRIGGLPCALHPRSTIRELTHVLGDLDAHLILAEEGASAALAAAAKTRTRVAGLGWHGPAGLVGENAGSPAPPLPREDVGAPAAIVYTSGTTGRPKGVLVTHAAYVYTGEAFPFWVGLGSNERLWATLPLHHLNAQAYLLMTALSHGYALAVSRAFHATTYWEEACRLGVTATTLVGAMLTMLARQPEESWRPTGLRVVYAAPAPAGSYRAALEQRFGVRIVTGYGMTESPFGCIESAASRLKPRCVGRARQHPFRSFTSELRIMSGGTVCPPSTVGELQLKNPTVTPGYWNAPRLTASRIVDGWLHTGDLGYSDQDGDIVLVGRAKEMIRRRGENISPVEIEEVLLLHPKVQLAAALGVPSELSEEDVVAFVAVSKPDEVHEDMLLGWCGEHLAPFKIPGRIHIRSDLPTTSTMRVIKAALRAELRECAPSRNPLATQDPAIE